MSRREKVEEVLGKAVVLEKRYDWVKAADFYKQASRVVRKKVFFRKGEIQEKIGYAFIGLRFKRKAKKSLRKECNGRLRPMRRLMDFTKS